MPFNPLIQDVFESDVSRETGWSFESGEKSQTRTVTVTGYDNPEDAAIAALNAADTTTPYYIPADLERGQPAMTVRGIRAKPLSPMAYDLSFEYKSLGFDGEDLTWSFSGQTEGATTTVSQGYEYARFGTGPDYGGAINVTKDGVDGIEIGIPSLEFNITKTLRSGSLNLDYVATLLRMTYTTNNSGFKTFARGELLFKGAAFSQRSQGETTVEFKFSASPNVTGLTIGSITDITKEGHDYLWVDYMAVESGGYIIRQPRTVFVHRVYQRSNFGNLQLDD